jgi:DNA polymerase-4
LDEAYLDVTENKKGMESANQIAREIRQKIFEETGLTASAGISVNKFLAKVASDINKPNGQKTIHPDKVEGFLEELPVEKFYGVGKVTANKMFSLGIYKGKDLKKRSLEDLVRILENPETLLQCGSGYSYFRSKTSSYPEKCGSRKNFFEDLFDEQQINEKLESLSQELHQRLQKNSILGRTLTLKIKYKDFSLFTRSIRENYFSSPEQYFNTGKNFGNCVLTIKQSDC